jgi:hypothetical protein
MYFSKGKPKISSIDSVLIFHAFPTTQGSNNFKKHKLKMKHTPVHDDTFYQRDRHYRCCCNTTHVERGAYIIAFLGAFLSALAAIGHFLTLNFVMVVVYLISLFVFLSIIWAQKKRNPNLYLPFLIINGIGLLLTLANLVFLIIAIIVMPEFYTHYIRTTYDHVTDHRHGNTYNTVVYSVLTVAIIISAITFAIYAWFYMIVLRAYQYMKNVQKIHVTSVPIGEVLGGPNAQQQVYHATTMQEVRQQNVV